MEQPDAALGVIREWRRKCFEHSNESNDPLLSLFAEGFDTISVVASPTSDSADILRSLEVLHSLLEHERSTFIGDDNKDFDVLRHLSYGIIESLYLLIKLQRGNSCEEQAHVTNDINEQILNLPPSSDFLPKVEPFDDYDYDYEMSNGNPSNPKEPKDEPVNYMEVVPTDNQISNLFPSSDFIAKEEPLKYDYELYYVNPQFSIEPKDELVDSLEVALKDKIVQDIHSASMRNYSVEKEKQKNYPLIYTQKITSNSSSTVNESEITRKTEETSVYQVLREHNYSIAASFLNNAIKRRFRDMEHNCNLTCKKLSKYRVSKLNKTELECPECEFQTRSVYGWNMHLKNEHSTTPFLAGRALLCECGNKSFSYWHAHECNIANFTVVREGNGSIKRLDDEKLTPQCVLCEKYPSSACGYMQHLPRRHKSTLQMNKIYLKCSCGVEIRSNYPIKHGKECDPRRFTLHKLEEN